MTAKNKSISDKKEEQTEFDFQDQSLESSLERLEIIVDKMDSEQVDLEESIALFKEGMALTQYCRKLIDDAEQQVTQLVADADGNLTLDDYENG